MTEPLVVEMIIRGEFEKNYCASYTRWLRSYTQLQRPAGKTGTLKEDART